MKIILGLVVVAIVVFFFLQKDSPITNYPSSGTDIVAFGDSLVRGVGASSSEKNFISLLSAGIGQPIVNLGKSGDTTSDGISRLSELDAYNPKAVILLLGGNDTLRKIPVDVTFENLAQIIEHIHNKGSTVLLLGVRGSLLGDKYKDRFEELQETYHVGYVEDVLDGLFADSRFMSDAIHPNDLGYEMIAKRVLPELLELIR